MRLLVSFFWLPVVVVFPAAYFVLSFPFLILSSVAVVCSGWLDRKDISSLQCHFSISVSPVFFALCSTSRNSSKN
jgi:hypothetical protein